LASRRHPALLLGHERAAECRACGDGEERNPDEGDACGESRSGAAPEHGPDIGSVALHAP